MIYMVNTNLTFVLIIMMHLDVNRGVKYHVTKAEKAVKFSDAHLKIMNKSPGLGHRAKTACVKSYSSKQATKGRSPSSALGDETN